MDYVKDTLNLSGNNQKDVEALPQKIMDYVKDTLNLSGNNRKEAEETPRSIVEDSQYKNLNNFFVNIQKSLVLTEAATQVRNKLISGYQELSNLPL
ncbi:MAG: flagellar hook-basal body complex protein FliE [Buchnera aphidicola (Schlechtendalia peitan)]